MLPERILAMMRDFNPLWESKTLAVPDYHRLFFQKAAALLSRKQMLAITGLRRVGKTVMMRQLMSDLAKTTASENIFYFLFDDLVAQHPDILADLLDYYLKNIAGKGTKYIFLDEIQKVPGWQGILKRHYDTREDVKFSVSGSASLDIRKSKESLAGRIFELHLPPLTFREFLELNGIRMGKVGLDYPSLRGAYEKNVHKKPMLEAMLMQYLRKGAFPEIAVEKDRENIMEYIRSSVIEKMIYKDIPAVFKVRRKDVLFSILEYCARETSNLLDIGNLAKTLSVNYLTARTYLFYLSNSFVLDMIYNHSGSAARQLRKSKKVHIIHPSITIALMRYPDEILNVPEVAGHYAETVVFQHVRLLSDNISFWRTPQKEEVDIVAETGSELMPIEVKFRASVDDSDAKTVLKFMEKYGSEKGLVITKDVLSERKLGGKTVLFIPVWLFLLVV